MSVSRPAGVLLAVFLLGSAGVGRAAARKPPREDSADRWVRETMKSMAVDEKIGQLLVPALNGMETSTDSEAFDQILRNVRDFHVGGYHVFGATEAMPNALLNLAASGPTTGTLGDPLGTAALLNRMQREAKIPLLTSADFEGGAGYIMRQATRYPREMGVGATRDEKLAYDLSKLTAQEGRAIGVTVDLVPVADVNSNPRNPIINYRSFGENVELVSQMVRACIRGIHDGGMLATAKHFPGHGDTGFDTHLELSSIDKPRGALEAVELPPFKAAIDAGVDFVMSSHIIVPAFDPTPRTPATLSHAMLTDLLRQQLGFKGLAITDSMAMNAISKNFPKGEATVRSVLAGADVVLDMPSVEESFTALKAAVESGAISRERLDGSVERILRAKARLGLHANRFVDLQALDGSVGGRARMDMAIQASGRALTLVKDDPGNVPLRVPRDARVVYLSVLDYTTGWREGAPSRLAIAELKQRFPNATAVEITDHTTLQEMDLVRALAAQADAIVASVFVRIASYSGRMDLGENEARFLEALVDLKKPYIATLFGNPYSAMTLKRLPTLVLAYDTHAAAEVAAVRAAVGEAGYTGRLPINIPDLYKFGDGLQRAPLQTSSKN